MEAQRLMQESYPEGLTVSFSAGSLHGEVQLHTSLQGRLLAQLSVYCVIKQGKPELFFFYFSPEYSASFPFLGSKCVGYRVSF